ncbi:MAG: hypothetical protein CME06_16445, partial [Gemmatimonadetes bacterium]|nr:hypothetical protein [Gemmatimonadota bacterium]
MRSGAVDQGQRAARRLLREKPNDARHEALMADAYRARGNLKGSLASSGRALDLDDLSPEAHASKGATLLAAGNQEHATRSFRRALALDPFHAPALRGWAELLLKRPLPPAAADLALLDTASERISRDCPLSESYARLLVAADRAEEAERNLKALLRTHPSRFEARLVLAEAAANPMDALAQLDTLRRQALPAARAIAALSLSSDDPIPELLRAHRLAPGDRAIVRKLVQAQMRAGDLAAARSTLAGTDTVSVEHTELLLAAGAIGPATDALRSLAPTLNESGRERIAKAFGEAGQGGRIVLDSLVVTWPESAAPLAARAAIAHRKKRYGAAADDLRAALRRSRGDCTLTARLMSALRHDGDPHAAWRVTRGAVPLACEEAALTHQSALTALAVGDSAAADSMWWALGAEAEF